MNLAKKVVAALKNKDMKSLAAFVHPVKGVRFSPFAYVDIKEDLTFKGSRLENLINGTYAEYYEDFVYDYDFAKPDKINYNLKKK
jgi:hypothetical protein